MSSFIVAALSVLISLVAVVVVIITFKYVRQFTSQLQQFSNTLNDIQSRIHTSGGSATSSISAAPVQASAPRTPTGSGSPRIFIQKQGSSKTRPIDPRAPTPGMAGHTPPPTVISTAVSKPEPKPEPKPKPQPKAEPEREVFINFDCPECGQNLDAPPGMAGTQITCPACNKQILIPTKQAKKQAPAAAHPPPSSPPADNAFRETAPDALRKDVTIRIDLNATPELQEPDQASITVKRQDIKVRRV